MNLNPTHWTRLCDESQLPVTPGQGKYLVCAGRAYALFVLHDGSLRLMDDTCPHAGASLSGGHIDRESNCVVCPWHAWPFDIDGGQCPDNPEIAVQTYEVKREHGAIWGKIETCEDR